MPFSDTELDAILNDGSKRIEGDVATGLGELFRYSPHGEYERVRTPFLYPDGDNIDLFCKRSPEALTISDLGETTRWLRMQTVSPRRSPKQRALIEDTCLTHGVELYRGMLLARVRPGEAVAPVITRVGQAALRVSDLWFTYSRRQPARANPPVPRNRG